ncbi:CD209 antigen-like [Oratosquilla oratoria]|uniref:CD209 antigen-like n=1 Tax=Oratosquilla oratoria TaxID=337810 RepID=UPI003F760FE9
MALSIWPKILLVALVTTRVCGVAKRTFFRPFRREKCPDPELMDFEDGALNVSVCVLRCRAMVQCSGVCYNEDTRVCRIFTNFPIASALDATEAPGYVMWWRDYPKSGSTFKNKVYVLMEGRHGPETAMAICKDIGATLPIPKNDEENQYISSLTTTPIWLGMEDKQEEGVFVSAEDGSPVTYFNWGSSQPNNLDDNQDCVETSGGNWNDEYCYDVNAVVCVMDEPNCSSDEPGPLCFLTDPE